MEPDERTMMRYAAGRLTGNELEVYAVSPRSDVARELAKHYMLLDGDASDVFLMPIEHWQYERARVNMLHRIPYIIYVAGDVYT